MEAEDSWDLRSDLHKEGIVFCYCGYMTEQVLTGIGRAIRDKLTLEEVDKKIARALFSLFVEQVQNVIRYSAERESNERIDPNLELSYGFLSVGQNERGYFVSCGNLIAIEDSDRLNRDLTQIQQMTAEELKILYKTTLRGETPEGSKGAGVGLIDIARRARKGFEFGFRDVDDKHVYFAMQAFV